MFLYSLELYSSSSSTYLYLLGPLAFYFFLFFFIVGLLRLQSIFQDLSFTNESFRIDVVKQISSANETLNILREIEMTNR